MSGITRPLNSDAVSAADEELYANHKDDKRPNALFDKDGNRKKLDATDPSQADLRKEWCDLYEKHNGEVENPDEPPETPPDEPLPDCPDAPVVPEEPEEPDPTITAKWSKHEVVPNHNSTYPPATAPTDTIPDDAKVEMIVDTTNVPDGTTASITVRHCVTGAAVTDGTIANLVVQGNQVVDDMSGERPVFVWEAKHDPWSIWNKPFYYFDVTVDYRGLADETPKDFKRKRRKCVRVLYWSITWADTTSGLSGVAPEGRGVRRAINKRRLKSKCITNNQSAHTPLANVGSVFRNTYAMHIGSHGNFVERSTDLPTWHYQSGTINPPSFTYTGARGQLPSTAFRSTITMGRHTPRFVNFPAPSRRTLPFQWQCDQLGDTEVGVVANFPSMPKVLLYASCCLAGWESSFADAVVGRGCQNVIAFRKAVPDDDAKNMGRRYFRRWAREKLDPAKVPSVFFRIGRRYYGSMRPVLFGLQAGAIAGGAGTAATAQTEALNETINDLSIAIEDLLNP